MDTLSPGYVDEYYGSGFDIVKSLSSITPEGIEYHLRDRAYDGKIRKCSFCGPNTQMDKRIENFDPKTGKYDRIITPPISDLDKACLSHDIAYSIEGNDLNSRHEADRVLIREAEKIYKNPASKVNKLTAGLVLTILKGKLKLGIGLGERVDISYENGLSFKTGSGIYYNLEDAMSDSDGLDEKTKQIVIGLLILAQEIGISDVLKLVKND